MKDGLNFVLKNKMKTSTKMEDDPTKIKNIRRPQKILNGRPKKKCKTSEKKWTTTSNK